MTEAMHTNEGHGAHWEVLLDGPEALKERVLRPAMERGETLPAGRGPFADGRFGGAYAQTMATTDLRPLVLWGIDERAQALHLLSAYPFASVGIGYRCKLTAVHPWASGAEAVLEARLGPLRLAFFDPLYYLNHGRYAVGTVAEFVLAGLAYGLTGPDASALAGVAALMPLAGSAPDDYTFRGPVTELERFELDGEGVYALTVTVARPDGEAVDLIVYAPDRAIAPGFVPAVGGDVAGTLWLQGYFAEALGVDG